MPQPSRESSRAVGVSHAPSSLEFPTDQPPAERPAGDLASLNRFRSLILVISNLALGGPVLNPVIPTSSLFQLFRSFFGRFWFRPLEPNALPGYTSDPTSSYLCPTIVEAGRIYHASSPPNVSKTITQSTPLIFRAPRAAQAASMLRNASAPRTAFLHEQGIGPTPLLQRDELPIGKLRDRTRPKLRLAHCYRLGHCLVIPIFELPIFAVSADCRVSLSLDAQKVRYRAHPRKKAACPE